MYFLLPTLILISYSIVTFYYIFKNKKEKIAKDLFINEILIAILFLVAGFLFPFMYTFHSPGLSIKTVHVLWIITSLIFTVEMIVWIITLLYNSLKLKNHPEKLAEKNYDLFGQNLQEIWKKPYKSEFGRKFLHILTSIVVLVSWIIGLILEYTGILSHLGLEIYSFSLCVIVTAGFGFVIMFQIADLARLNRFYLLPNWAISWYKAMRPDELNTFISSTPLILSFVPFVFTPFPIFAGVVLISTVADATACLIGKKFGKYKLKKDSDKTIEGFLAGGISTFLIVVFITNVFHIWIPVNWFKIISMAFVATIIFLMVDLFSKNISDNILNPLLTGFGMWIILII